MSRATETNLKIFATVLLTLGTYTLVANIIPQVESDVPEQIVITDDITPTELAAAGERLFAGAGGCEACHGLGERAPNLRADHAGEGPIGVRCAERVEGMSCKEFLYESLVNPGDHVVEGFPPIMPPADRALNQEQIWALVAYLESLGGEVTVTTEDIRAAEDEVAAAPDEPADEATGPVALLQQFDCLLCHTHEGEGVPLGPSFDAVGARLSAEEIRTKILDPAAFVSEGYENLQGTMPGDFGQRMTDEQLDEMVEYLASLQ